MRHNPRKGFHVYLSHCDLYTSIQEQTIKEESKGARAWKGDNRSDKGKRKADLAGMWGRWKRRSGTEGLRSKKSATSKKKHIQGQEQRGRWRDHGKVSRRPGWLCIKFLSVYRDYLQCQLCPKIIKPARLGEFRQHLKQHLKRGDLPPPLRNKLEHKDNKEDEEIMSRFPGGQVSCLSSF